MLKCWRPKRVQHTSSQVLTMLLRSLLLLALLSANDVTLLSASASKDGMEQELDYLKKNSEKTRPDPRPVQFTEQEINAFVAGGGVKLPAGVQSLRFQGRAGVITAFAKVNFDQVRAGSHSYNPLLSVFSGLHDVVVVAHGEATHGEAKIHVDSVSLDEVEVPNFVLSLFVEKFIQPKHPELGIDSRFPLPERIDSAIIGERLLTVQQK